MRPMREQRRGVEGVPAMPWIWDDGDGMMEITHSVRLEIPPGARSGDRYQIDLRSAGIENLLLDVTIVVA